RRRRPRRGTLFPYTTLFRSVRVNCWMSSVSCSCRNRNPVSRLMFHRQASAPQSSGQLRNRLTIGPPSAPHACILAITSTPPEARSEEHTSELQSSYELVCRL